MPLLEMKPPTAKLTLAVFFLPSSHSLAARGMIHLSRPFRVQIYGDSWQRWPRKASSGAAIPLANGAAAPEVPIVKGEDETHLSFCIFVVSISAVAEERGGRNVRKICVTLENEMLCERLFTFPYPLPTKSFFDARPT